MTPGTIYIYTKLRCDRPYITILLADHYWQEASYNAYGAVVIWGLSLDGYGSIAYNGIIKADQQDPSCSAF